jgi:hypothetical protein
MRTAPEARAGETLDDGSTAGTALVPVRPHLFLMLEADRPLAGGARYGLAGIDEVVLGRGDERSARRTRREGKEQLFIRVPGRWMSSTHARLLRVRGAWVLEDAQSRNGTYVGGERVQRRTLADGDTFEAGHCIFRFRDTLPTPPKSPSDLDATSLRALSLGLRTLLPSLSPRYEELARVARSEVPVVLLGETGTGKEVLARTIHELSGRRGAFVAVNCGSLSPALIESLLFGHVKGSFSGANRDEIGFVRAADGGTLFLDEVGDFPSAAQPSLLRVLQEREVVPVGSSRPIQVDLRVVSATHRALDALVDQGTFRRDLLMRLDGYRQALVPLRDRREDLGLIVAELIERRPKGESAALTTAAARALIEYEWIGNVRELEQSLARALALSTEGHIDVAQLGIAVRPREATTRSDDPADVKLREELVRALEAHRGNVTDVARTMGKARMQVQRWMRRLGIDPEAYRGSR